MPYRDEHGRFIPEEEARERGLILGGEPQVDPGEEEPEWEGLEQHDWAEQTRDQQPIYVDTGRGQATEVAAGSPFVPTLERLAEEHNYGGYYRIFLNGHEIVDPTDSPPTIGPGMRIAITSYDKVG